MDAQDAVDLVRQAIVVAAIISSPILLAGLVVGLAIGLLQAVTQVQEQSVAFVPKLMAMALVVALALPWLVDQMIQYSQEVIANIPATLS